MARPGGIGRIVSGGQTGADRAALDFAIERGVAHGGWCPRGGWAEDLTEPPGLLARYPTLRETPSADPEQRTRWNVRDSEATLILTRAGSRSAGTEATERAAAELGRPHLVIEADDPRAAATIATWLDGLPDAVAVNVAGPRESEAPGMYARVRELLAEI